MSVNFDGFEFEKGYLQRDIAEQSGALVLKLAANSGAFFFPTYSKLIQKAWLHHPEDRSLQTLHTGNPEDFDENSRIVEALSVFEEVNAKNMGQRAVSSFFLVYKPQAVLLPHYDAENDSTVVFNLTGNGTLNLYDGDIIAEQVPLEPGDKYTLTPDIKHSLSATGDNDRVVMVLNSPHVVAEQPSVLVLA